MSISLFKTATEGQVFRPADFNDNMSQIETAVNTAQTDIDALEAGRVKNTTDETIAGVKTFSSPPIVPTPTTDAQAATKNYVDANDALQVHLTGDQTVAGVKTFSDSPVVPTPTTDMQASTKKYVDDTTTPIAHVGSGNSQHSAATNIAAGFMSSADKTKLDGISTGAEVNQNTFANVAVPGQQTITADIKTDTVTFKAGINVTMTTDPDLGEITINATGDIATNANNTQFDDPSGLYAATQVEAALTEIAGPGRTTETVKGNADAIALKAPIESPVFTGAPIVPTAALNTETTQAASTAFVLGQASATTPLVDGVAAVGSSKRFARADHVHPGVLNNYTATSDPTTGDDTGDGYSVGSEWINTTTKRAFKCIDASSGAAIWVQSAAYAYRYGFRRAKNNSQPISRIEYLYDAIGMQPAAMNMTSGAFNYGSWENWINSISRPVMLKTDGTVDYELSRADYTKKADGVTASDVSNTSYAGNTMIEFKKLWVRRYEDSGYEYVIFSNVQYDANYKAYAHQNALGNVKDAFYWGAFKGSNVSSKLRSIADQTVMVSQTRNTEASYAAANGAGYYTIYKSGWDFICDLLTLIGRTDDAQTTFGTGRCATGNTSAIATGTLKAQPQFRGYTDQTSDVKVFGIEGFWGNVWEGMAGLILDGANGVKAKMTPAYNFDASGYTATGITPSGTSGGYVSSASVTDASGYVPKVASGSSSTYYCDGLWHNNWQVDYALVGGNWGDGLLVGPRSVDLGGTASGTNVYLGSRLSYLNPA